MTGPALDLEPLDAFLTDLGVPRLRKALDDGTATSRVSDGLLETYCRVAHYSWDGPPTIADNGVDLREAVAAHLANILWQVAVGEGPLYREDDDSGAWVMSPWGEVAVTEEMMRHWEWLHSLLTDEPTARRLLAAAPAGIREAATASTEAGWQRAFDVFLGGKGLQ